VVGPLVAVSQFRETFHLLSARPFVLSVPLSPGHGPFRDFSDCPPSELFAPCDIPVCVLGTLDGICM